MAKFDELRKKVSDCEDELEKSRIIWATNYALEKQKVLKLQAINYELLKALEFYAHMEEYKVRWFLSDKGEIAKHVIQEAMEENHGKRDD